MKKLLAAVAGLILIAAIAGGVVVTMFVRGSFGLDDWVVRRVVAIAETYLVPRIEFASFNFEMPGTVTFNGVELIAPDETKVVSAETMVVTLAERPQRGQPIIIEGIELDGATLLLLQSKAPDGSVTFKGLVPFVDRAPMREQQAQPEDVRLSNVLQIRQIALRNAGVSYDIGDGSPPMEIRDITLDLNAEPVTEADGAVWHKINTVIDRAPILHIGLDMRISLDTMMNDLDTLTLDLDLSNEQGMKTLPPQVQNWLRGLDARGRLTADASGTISMTDPLQSRLEAAFSLTSFNIGKGDYRLPIQRASVGMTLSERVVDLAGSEIEVIGGRLLIPEGRVAIEDPPTGQLAWSGSELRLEQLLNPNRQGDAPPRFSGAVQTDGAATMQLNRIPESLEGEGTLNVREGRLLGLKVVDGLIRSLDLVGKLTNRTEHRDKADVAFTFREAGVQIDSLEMVTSVVAARGEGMVFYDGTLNMNVNAGPMEKVQSMLGGIGDIFGKITDSLVKYQVTGPATDPKITVRPLGIGANANGR